MAANTPVDPQLRHIFGLVKQQKYAEAAPLLQQYLKQYPNDADAVFLTAFFTNDRVCY